MGKTRKTYGREYKLMAVRQSLATGSVRRVARELGIPSKNLEHWKQDYQEDPTGAFPGKGHRRPEDEVTRLRRENAELRRENEFLKKTKDLIKNLEA
jgi:transposase